MIKKVDKSFKEGKFKDFQYYVYIMRYKPHPQQRCCHKSYLRNKLLDMELILWHPLDLPPGMKQETQERQAKTFFIEKSIYSKGQYFKYLAKHSNSNYTVSPVHYSLPPLLCTIYFFFFFSFFSLSPLYFFQK